MAFGEVKDSANLSVSSEITFSRVNVSTRLDLRRKGPGFVRSNKLCENPVFAILTSTWCA